MCTPRQLEIQCPSGSVMVIVSARFGRFDASNRFACRVFDMTECEYPGSYYFDKISKLCFKKEWCTYNVQPREKHFDEEPCPGVHKFLSLTYECVKSNDMIITFMLTIFVTYTRYQYNPLIIDLTVYSFSNRVVCLSCV